MQKIILILIYLSSISRCPFFLAYSHRVYRPSAWLCCQYEPICWFYNWLAICNHKSNTHCNYLIANHSWKNISSDECECVCASPWSRFAFFERSATCHVVSARDNRSLLVWLRPCTKNSWWYLVETSYVLITIHRLYVITISAWNPVHFMDSNNEIVTNKIRSKSLSDIKETTDAKDKHQRNQ